MTPCKICAQEIPDGARKCTKCGEFQSLPWRVLSGFDLKGLLALLPLLTLIYAFLAERLEPYQIPGIILIGLGLLAIDGRPLAFLRRRLAA